MSKGVINHYDFIRDLGRGAVGEDIAQVFLEKELGVVAENRSKGNKGWDLLITELKETQNKKKLLTKKTLKKFFKKDKTVEVKFDSAAARYNNFFVEILFDVEKGVAGTTFNCKADLMLWVVPAGSRKYKIYIFKRPEFLAWLIGYVLEEKNNIKIKTPGISPFARGIPIPIKDAKKSFSCLGEFDFKL